MPHEILVLLKDSLKLRIRRTARTHTHGHAWGTSGLWGPAGPGGRNVYLLNAPGVEVEG